MASSKQEARSSDTGTEPNHQNPLNVIMVGGSCAGLMLGILLKRKGHNVRIIEQAQFSDRQGLAAGIGLQPDTVRFFEEHDRLKEHPFAVPNKQLWVLNDDMTTETKIPIVMNLTSWDATYYRLRANYDAFVSDYCRDPPALDPNEGVGTFETGRKVVALEAAASAVTVTVQSSTDPDAVERISADYVVCADGANSSMRRQLLPNLIRERSGYVIWRGTVPYGKLSAEVIDHLKGHITYYCGRYNYVVIYTIPGENGTLAGDGLMINFAWYFWVSPGEAEEVLTDKFGHHHRTTLPMGTMRSEVWDRQLAAARKILPPPLVEVVENISQPFVSIITNITSTRAAFFNDRVFLIGDALAQVRPHLGSGTNLAAMNALTVAEVIDGKMAASEWEERALTQADLASAITNVWGTWYLCTWYGFLKHKARYYYMVYSQRFCKYWFGSAYLHTRYRAN